MLSWLLARLETYQLYYPTPLRGETPDRWGLPYEDVRIDSGSAVLQAWWVPRPEPEAPLLLFLHGNAGNREDRLHNVQGLWRAGSSVLIVDYRGYGGSTGAPSEQGLLADGLASFDWLAARHPGRPIAIFGRSLGAAVAAHVAANRPAAGLILESAFTSAPDLAERLYPVPGLRHLVRSRYDTLSSLRTLKIPLLLIHGTRDELVPFDMGRTLFEASPSPDKAFHAVKDGRHNDTYLLAGEEYWRWIKDFLERIRRGPPRDQR